MSDKVHRYYCAYCQYSICGESAAALAFALNRHNETYHPADCSNWTSTGVTLSAHYVGPAFVSTELVKKPGPLPQYTRSFGTTSKDEWGGAKPPAITDDDKALLSKACIKW